LLSPVLLLLLLFLLYSCRWADASRGELDWSAFIPAVITAADGRNYSAAAAAAAISAVL
jgi:hypothetical protein